MATATKLAALPSAQIAPEDILTPDELAQRLKVGVGWVYEKCRERAKANGPPLPCLRMGRYLRFSWTDVCAWLRSNHHA